MIGAVFRRAMTWNSGEGTFSLGEGEAGWRLTLPDGQFLELAPADWLSIASAVAAFEPSARRVSRSSHVPANAGKPWTAELDDRLRLEWGKNTDERYLARLFERTPGAIASRLLRLGLLTDPK